MELRSWHRSRSFCGVASPVDSFPRMRGCYLAGYRKAFHPSRAAVTTTGRHKVSMASWVQSGWSHGGVLGDWPEAGRD